MLCVSCFPVGENLSISLFFFVRRRRKEMEKKSSYHYDTLNTPTVIAVVRGGINEEGIVSSEFDNCDGWPQTRPPKRLSVAKPDTD